MKRVVTGAILIPLVLALIFKGSYLLVVLVTALVAELALWEYLSIANVYGAETPRMVTLGAVALLFASIWEDPDLAAPAVLFCTLLLFAVSIFRSPLKRLLADLAFSVLGLIYIGLGLTTIPLLAHRENGRSLLLFLFCVVWSGDVAALYFGRLFGRRKLAPVLSPKKTSEGSAASVAASLLAAVLLVYLARTLEEHAIFTIAYSGSLLHWLALAAILNVAAQFGDLFESALKRGGGVKDSGSLLPGHGGMLDRIDALLLAAPVLWYAQLIQQYF